MATLPAAATPLASAEPSPVHGAEVSRITDWLIAQGLLRVRIETLFGGFCERLQGLGIPIWRAYMTTRALHPTIYAIGHAWRPGAGVTSEQYTFRVTPSPEYLTSPVRHMTENRFERWRVRLDQPSPFPLLEQFRAEGAKDYFARLVGFGLDGESDPEAGMVTTWATDRPGGFSESEIAILDHLAPRLALALQARLGHETAVNLLDTYVGPEAGRRILNGEIRRGSFEVIRAVIFYADLRGFTTVADRSPREVLVEMLNAYFDCLVPVVASHGGQVLKFLGDGLLATFPLDDRPPAEVCSRALDAAAESLACLQQLNADRGAAGRPAMDLDMVLHLGDVFYGNVGSADRLDFTVVGPAVNEASRIEALCAQYERHVLISEAFALAASESSGRLVAIGRFALRGVRGAQTIYTLDDGRDRP